MVYRYCENRNFEDLASGRVLLHKSGSTNFPVRLAQEIFGRCLHYLDVPDHICIYDPCCGGGYLLTVLGFLNFERIQTIIASDIDNEAVRLAGENLALLHRDGLGQRIGQLEHLFSSYHKDSHAEALGSAARLLKILTDTTHEIEHRVFQADLLSTAPFGNMDFKADIIFTDVPYGNLAQWQNGKGDINLPDLLLPVAKAQTVVAICSDKSQKFRSEHFRRVEKQVIGKRMFQIYQLGI